MKKECFIILLAAILIAGCGTKRKNYIILFDNSKSIPEEIVHRYIRVIQESILPGLGNKDRLTLQMIDEGSLTRSERMLSLDLSDYDFADKHAGLNNAEKTSMIRKKRFLNDSVKAMLENVIFQKRQERRDFSDYTDIINAINQSVSIITRKSSFSSETDQVINGLEGEDNYEFENCIIIFSDMINEDREGKLNFSRMGSLNGDRINKIVAGMVESGRIPNLKDVKVIIYGATSGSQAGVLANRQIENIKLFWKLYFSKAGADLIAYSFDTEKEIFEYVNNNRDN